MKVKDEDVERLSTLAEKNGWDTLNLELLFGIDHDRTNNGGVREVIEIALADGDDPDWIEEIVGKPPRR